MKTSLHLSLILFGAVLLTACNLSQASPATPTEGPDEPVSSESPTPPAGGEEPPAGETITGENAIVEELRLNIMESFPLQVSATIQGFLPDGCTAIKEITSSRAGDNFPITILTQRPAEAMCTQALVPFEETVSLDVLGLPAGTYTVTAGDQSATFTFDMDNVLQEEAACPESAAGQSLFEIREPDSAIAYCFLHPADFFQLGSGIQNLRTLAGPAYGEGPEPVSAVLTIVTQNAAGSSLEEFVAEKLAEFQGMELAQHNITLGQEPAILVTGMPGRLANRVIFVEHADIIYELTFSPDEEAFPEAQADMERLYESTLSSWTFLN